MQTRKLNAEECYYLNGTDGVRAGIEREYDGYLGDFAAGEYGACELAEGENKQTVRNRLKAAALRRNLTIKFIKTKGSAIRFRLDEVEFWPTSQ